MSAVSPRSANPIALFYLDSLGNRRIRVTETPLAKRSVFHSTYCPGPLRVFPCSCSDRCRSLWPGPCQSSARSSRKRLLNARRVASGDPSGFPGEAISKDASGGLLTASKARSVGALDWQVPLTEKFCYTGAVVGMRLNGFIWAPLKAQPATSVELRVRYWTVEGSRCGVRCLLAIWLLIAATPTRAKYAYWQVPVARLGHTGS